MAKRYNIKQTATNLDVNIDIPKDMVVESGTVETKAEAGAWGEAGTYLHLVLANATEDNIYINVGSLIEYVTSGSKVGDQIVIDVSADHKVTATLTEGSVTLAQLHADVQTAIGKAHSHTNKAELDKIVTGDKAKWDAAEQKAHEHGNKTILDTISQDKVDAWMVLLPSSMSTQTRPFSTVSPLRRSRIGTARLLATMSTILPS